MEYKSDSYGTWYKVVAWWVAPPPFRCLCFVYFYALFSPFSRTGAPAVPYAQLQWKRYCWSKTAAISKNPNVGSPSSYWPLHIFISWSIPVKGSPEWDFPGGPVVKNPPSKAGDVGSIPGRGTKIPHASGPLSPRASTREPACHNYRAYRLWSPRATTGERKPTCHS